MRRFDDELGYEEEDEDDAREIESVAEAAPTVRGESTQRRS